MKQLLLKRNVSMTKPSLKELLAPIKGTRSEKKRKIDEPFVEQFLRELREAGVKTIGDEGRRGNHFRFEQGKAGVEVSLHESSIEPAWWGVPKTTSIRWRGWVVIGG